MNYNNFFENDAERDFYYNANGERILVNGFISLENARKRISKNEYYTLVSYTEGDELPNGYIPITEAIEGVEDKFASVDPKLNFFLLSRNGGIQMISQLPSPTGDAKYLLGPGPDTILLSNLVYEQLDAYKNDMSHGKTM